MFAGERGDNQNEWEPDKSGADWCVELFGLQTKLILKKHQLNLLFMN